LTHGSDRDLERILGRAKAGQLWVRHGGVGFLLASGEGRNLQIVATSVAKPQLAGVSTVKICIKVP
jgi:hypothetical protein